MSQATQRQRISRLLLAGADTARRADVAALLDQDGFHVLACDSPESACKCIEAGAFGAVVLTIGTKDQAAAEWLLRIRRVDAEIPIILHTADAAPAPTVVATSDKIFAVVADGAPPDLLLRQVRRALQTRLERYAAALEQVNARLNQEIEQRERVEAALRDSEERFRQLAENIREVFWMTSIEERRVLYVSPAYEEIWGRPTSALYERFDAWIDAIHHEDRERVRTANRRNRAAGEYDETYRIVRPDGAIRWIHDRGFVVCNAAGKPVRIVGLAADVTPVKHADEELQHQQADLAHLSRLSLMGELAANLAHELNQPLGAIVNYTQGSLRRIAAGHASEAELARQILRVSEQAERAAAIIRRLRDFVGKRESHRAPADLNDIVHSSIRLMEVEARHRGVVFHLDLADGSTAVMVDRIQIEQVLVNLILNSIEATDGVEPARRRVTIATRREPSGITTVSVCDQGGGLSVEVAARLFEPYFTTKPTGMGLGLSISRRIVEACGGRIGATVNRDFGATFQVVLPSCAAHPTRAR